MTYAERNDSRPSGWETPEHALTTQRQISTEICDLDFRGKIANQRGCRRHLYDLGHTGYKD